MPNQGLSVNDVVNVNIVLAPQPAQGRNFGSLLILGDSNVVDVFQRLRLYTSLASIAADFGTNAPEYTAASLFFGQSPVPQQCYVGRWASTATHGVLQGAALSAAQQLLSNFTGINNGGIAITVDGVAHNLTGINLTAASNLNAVAASLQTALGGAATVTFSASVGNFVVQSATTGTASTVAFATAGAGTDLSVLLGLQSTQGGYQAAGIAAETLANGVAALANQSNSWYGLQIASTVQPADSDYLAVAAFIEASTVTRIFAVTTQEAGALVATTTTDLASLMQAAGYHRTFVQYSSSSPYASASAFGRAFTVDFTGANTTITLKFKQEPGVTPEFLTETQAATLIAKSCNVFVEYNNATAILQNGTMANGQYFDTVHGTDWLQNALQTGIYNLLFTSTTKIPQTDQGVNQLIATASATMDQSVTNGLVAPGVWGGPSFGAIVTGQTLSKGYYVYAPPVSTQSVAARAARQSPVIQIAAKLAGAIHSANLIVNVNQ